MLIPVYVVSGFLEAGKTSFLNHFLNKYQMKKKKLLVIQFEEGNMKFLSKNNNCSVLSFPIQVFEQDKKKIISEINNNIEHDTYNEIWIEWNGSMPFSRLQSLLLQSSLCERCTIEKVIHITTFSIMKNLLGRTGNVLPEQISNSDLAVLVGHYNKTSYHQVHQMLKSIHSDLRLYPMDYHTKIYKRIYTKKEDPIGSFMAYLLFLILLFIIAEPLLGFFRFPINKIVIVFLGIILQAIPFLLIGVLLSSIIQVFVKQEFIEQRFPKSLGVGMVMALFLGFCIPVCDCATIPIFRSLVKKGIPIPVAVTFMTAAPVINPVVMLSTYYAYGGDMIIVVSRVSLGILSALAIGIIFSLWYSKEDIFASGYDYGVCSCGCTDINEAGAIGKRKFDLFVRHSQTEFFNVGKYLIIGTMISAVIQTFGMNSLTSQSGYGYMISILFMMVMAFVLSLCSSSDAIIARSFTNQMPIGAVMGFLVFGPMIDIKNVLMLSSGFSKRFIVKLVLVTFIVCFSVVSLYTKFILGGM